MIKKDSKTFTSKDKAIRAARLAHAKHAEEIVVLHVASLTSLADYFVLCTADSGRQLRAVADAVQEGLSKEGIKPLGVEGLEGASWVLMDYSDFILHIFRAETRTFYDLDRLWADAPRVAVRPQKAKAPSRKIAGKGGVSFHG